MQLRPALNAAQAMMQTAAAIVFFIAVSPLLLTV